MAGASIITKIKGFSKIFLTAPLFAVLLFAGSSEAQTYTTIANGDWMDSTTWAGGSIPTQDEFAASVTININHNVFYDRGTPLKNRGVFRVQKLGNLPRPRFTIPTNINFDNFATGDMYILNADFVQCRFVGCNNGQPYNGSDPQATKQSGTVKNEGGYVEVRGSFVEVAQDWENIGGVRIMIDSCLFTGQDFAVVNGGDETIIRSAISIGWHGSGNFQVSNSKIRLKAILIQMAGTSGNVQFDSAARVGGVSEPSLGDLPTGDIDYITFYNEFGNFTGSGEIFADPSLKNLSNNSVSNIIDLAAYCISSPSKYNPNGKFFGSQTPICDGRFACGVTAPSAAPAAVSGRVTDASGRGMRGIQVTASGGNLTQGVSVFTNTFGYYRIENLEAGNSYIISASSGRYLFSSTHFVSLEDNLSGIDFQAVPPSRMPPQVNPVQKGAPATPGKVANTGRKGILF